MKKEILDFNSLNQNVWNGVIGEFKLFIKGIVRESVKEVIDEMNIIHDVEDQRLTSEQLCNRWTISQNTLRSWEKDGVIRPLPIGGRKKIYSMSSVLDVENSGYLKRVS